MSATTRRSTGTPFSGRWIGVVLDDRTGLHLGLSADQHPGATYTRRVRRSSSRNRSFRGGKWSGLLRSGTSLVSTFPRWLGGHMGQWRSPNEGKSSAPINDEVITLLTTLTPQKRAAARLVARTSEETMSSLTNCSYREDCAVPSDRHSLAQTKKQRAESRA